MTPGREVTLMPRFPQLDLVAVVLGGPGADREGYHLGPSQLQEHPRRLCSAVRPVASWDFCSQRKVGAAPIGTTPAFDLCSVFSTD